MLFEPIVFFPIGSWGFGKALHASLVQITFDLRVLNMFFAGKFAWATRLSESWNNGLFAREEYIDEKGHLVYLVK